MWSVKCLHDTVLSGEFKQTSCRQAGVPTGLSLGNWLVSLFGGISCAVVRASQAGHLLVDGTQVWDSVPYRVPVKEVQRRCDAV